MLFISNRRNNYDIYTMTVDGNNVKRLMNSAAYDGSCSFSPDNSKYFLFLTKVVKVKYTVWTAMEIIKNN
ncbi:MAG: hypothetical protein IIB07_09800 [Bacteroidetes bacterium]|nr:hypothetical protein [Bacteroidota bacterium]